MRTAYADVDEVLSLLVPGMRDALGDLLLGAYVFGSVASGDYDRGVSDVDLLAVVDVPLTGADLPALERMHSAVVRALPDWDDRVEVLYVSTEALRTFRDKATPIAVISPGEPLNIKPAGIEWLMNWWDVREYGLTLFGPPPTEFVAPIGRDEFVAIIRAYAEEFPHRLGESSTAKWQSYITLTMCRSLHTCSTGEAVSKRAAAAWASACFPDWAAHVDFALRARLAGESRQASAADLSATANFVAFSLAAMRAAAPDNS